VLDRIIKENNEFKSAQQGDNVHVTFNLVLKQSHNTYNFFNKKIWLEYMFRSRCVVGDSVRRPKYRNWSHLPVDDWYAD
jgi:hypothetical protein